MLRQLGVDPPIRVESVDAERLLTRFKEASFDLIHSANALDHAWDPMAAIESMLDLLRPRGVVYLIHHRNEGADENYTMLHRWDFDAGGVGERDAIIRSAHGQTINVTARLLGKATVKVQVFHNVTTDEDGQTEDLVEFVIRKHTHARKLWMAS
eukprot:gnl/TRDRNA2_/TRDRNA2_139290_c0_seq1.p1 gnl/TRDRNA2_/TRDRNA2_139290_c0~~gnl/TRDRNA2_/TRDRNA2_139290_c0_seq1.p1  ORF type:complete len:171 (+),score=16.98 gnl/TRDRNA2_/TRDRNA2_139290_c0_seq1:54-515(+)